MLQNTDGKPLQCVEEDGTQSSLLEQDRDGGPASRFSGAASLWLLGHSPLGMVLDLAQFQPHCSFPVVKSNSNFASEVST